ncbi:MAG: peptide deformylase [Roseobacter sp.]
MSIRDILCWPDPRLRTVCAPVAEVTEDVRKLAADMLETMYAAPGRGLAAPQVGVLERLFVMDTSWKEAEPTPQVFINPLVSPIGDTHVSQYEGCLSLPGIAVDVSRPDKVHLRWTDLEGRAQEAAFDGFAAACIQHEVDHLDGRVTLDHVDEERRASLIAQYQQAAT